MNQTGIRTHYDNLQVARTASDEVIRGAYRYLSQKYHPDKQTGNREQAERVMKIINEAYDVLSDPDKRRAHDEWIAQEEASAAAAGKHADEGTRPPDETPHRGVRSSLSPEVRDEYSRSIARGALALYILGGVFAGLLNVGLWSLFRPIAAFMDRHPWAALLLFAVTVWTVAKESYEKKLRTVSAYDDDRLHVVYGAANRRRTVVIIAGSILLVGAVIAVSVLVKENRTVIADAAQQPSTTDPQGVAQQASAPAGSVAAVPEAPVSTAPAEPEVHVLEDNPTLVAKGDAYNFDFKTPGTLKVRVVVSVDGDMPVDVLTMPETSKSEFMDMVTNLQATEAVGEADRVAAVFGMSSEEDRKHVAETQAAIEDVFRTGLAKRGVYRHYESAWITLKQGTYSVFIDNTDAFTPSRADAPVKIELQSREL